MTHPSRDHRAWIASLGAAILGLLLLDPICHHLEGRLANDQMLLTAQKNRLELQLHQWTQDAHTAKELSKTLSPDDVNRLLAPSDRKMMTAQIEPFAAAARLANVTYALEPAKPWDGADSFPGIKAITVSDLTIEADAPDDSDVFTFLASLSALTGRVELTDLDLMRLRDKGEAEPAALNLHMKAQFKWFANASERTE